MLSCLVIMLSILVCYVAKVFSKGGCADANVFSIYAKCFSIGYVLSILVREVVVVAKYISI